jgi:hypothetical protein
LLRGRQQTPRAQKEKGQENRATHGINLLDDNPGEKPTGGNVDSHRTVIDPKNRTKVSFWDRTIQKRNSQIGI